jgi:hypothetical protein
MAFLALRKGTKNGHLIHFDVILLSTHALYLTQNEKDVLLLGLHLRILRRMLEKYTKRKISSGMEDVQLRIFLSILFAKSTP